MTKDTRQLVKRLRRLGYEVEVRRGGHLGTRVNGQLVVFPATPSDPRSLKNTRADLRRAGVAL